jgi:hypothetical protein
MLLELTYKVTFSNFNVWFARIRENYFLREISYLQTKKENLY